MKKMRKKAGRRPKAPVPKIPENANPNSIYGMASRFLETLAIRNFSKQTIDGREIHLAQFASWCEDRSIMKPGEVTKPIVDRFQRYLFHYRKKTGGPLGFGYQLAILVSIKVFFRWLTKNNHTLYNPASEIELPKVVKRLPKHVLTIEEAETVINQTDIKSPLGLRDRAILETFYSTGLRRMELGNLRLYDLDIERGTLSIKEGKGRKDRTVPIGERAINWIEKYIYESRPRLLPNPGEQILFLSDTGDPYTHTQITYLVGKYVEKADIGKTGACHLFRHTMATLLLENGADVRYVQAMLGHERLETTEIYTHVSIKKLKEIHTMAHPARMEARKGEEVRKSEAEPPGGRGKEPAPSLKEPIA